MCELHKRHAPSNLTVENHHIIPQAWQNYKLQAEKLFDPRTATLCPTGHRNVHYWIVQIVKVPRTTPVPKRTKEQQMAWLALERWEAAGYTIDELRANKLWGEA